MTRRSGPFHDAAIGAAAGLVATIAIAAFLKSSKPLTGIDPAAPDAVGEPRIGSPVAATRAVERVVGDVPERREELATSLFQLAFGTALGAGYGLLAGRLPLVTAARGTLFGLGLFAVADEVLVPATGLSGKPANSPAEAHGGALAAHLLFGLVAESVRRALR